MTWLWHLDPAKSEGRLNLSTSQLFWSITSLSLLKPVGAGLLYLESRYRMSKQVRANNTYTVSAIQQTPITIGDRVH